MTGYERAGLVARAVARRLPGPAIITQTARHGAVAAGDEFRASAAAGHRPIWVATGGAWTGRDLRDRSVPGDRAGDDLLLTDMVIPALPFGTDRSAEILNNDLLGVLWALCPAVRKAPKSMVQGQAQPNA